MLLLVFFLLCAPALATASPLQAMVVSVLDGDTIKVNGQIILQVGRQSHPLASIVSVRVLGIDTPEKGWRAKCQRERDLGAEATATAQSFLATGDLVTLSSVKNDKYAGRVVAEVRLPKHGNRLLADILMQRGLAIPYDGGTKQGWCP